MVIYKNDYSKKEDFALWNLHQIRHRIASRKLSAEEINRLARETVCKHHLVNLKIFRSA